MPSDSYWLELHTDMPKHPQTLKLARLLHASRRETIGILADLWTWALPIVDKDGRMDGMTADDILSALDLTGTKKGNAIVAALLESGYLEQDGNVYLLHNWYFYAGRLNERREKERIKKRKQRDRNAKPSPAPVPPLSPGTSLGTSLGSPETTEQNKTEQNRTIVSDETIGAPGTAPSLSEIEDFCLGLGGTPAAAAAFYAQYARAGWLSHGKPIENWRGLLTNFVRSGGGQGRKGGAPAQPSLPPGGVSVPPNARRNAEALRRLLEEDDDDGT